MIEALLWIWQLPQNLLGYLVTVVLDAYQPPAISDPNIYTHYKTWLSSVSLGSFIIVNGYTYDNRTVLHEKGHQRQSKYLGPLYLLLIGLPSVIGNLLHRFIKFDYYKQPWEAWADKLGGVQR